jgi:tetratricopeptide (TPR) repeat protein
MRGIFCLAYSKSPDEIGDAVIELGKKLLTLKDGSPSEIHAVIAYELAEEATRTEAGNEQSQIITEAEKEATISLSLGKVGNATADYASGTTHSLDKNYTEALRLFLRALGEDSKRFACGYDLEYPIYSEAVAAAENSGDHAEAERLFLALIATGKSNGFEWDAEGDRRANHSEYLEAATAYQQSEDFFPINACYASNNYFVAAGDHVDQNLSEGRKCIDAAAKLDSTHSEKYAKVLSIVHAEMASNLNDRGVYTEALSHAKDSISLDSKYAYAYYEESKALESLGRSQECTSAA